MYHTNADYKETVALFPQNYRMEIEITFDESTGLDTVTVPPEDIFEAGFSEELFLSTFCIGSTVEPCFAQPERQIQRKCTCNSGNSPACDVI